MRVVWAIVALFSVRFGVAAWFEPGRDADLAWQRWLGLQILHTGHIPTALGPETFTAAGAQWIAQEWALSIAVALTWGTAWFVLLVVASAVACAASMAIIGWTARRLGASEAATALCVGCAGFAMLESFGVRAQVFVWPLLAAVFYLLRTGSPGARWWIVPIVALWANLHASAPLAPALLAVWTLGTAIDARGWNAEVRGYALLTAVSALAVCATPLGIHLPLYAISLLHSPIRKLIDEWQPTTIGAASFALGTLPLLAAGAILGWRPPRKWAEITVFAAAAWLAFSALRNIPVSAIVIAPYVAYRLTEYLPQSARVNRLFDDRGMLALIYAGCAVCGVFIALLLSRMPSFAQGLLPVRAVGAASAIAGRHRLYCEDFAWCSLALSHSNMQLFIDGRCDPFPLSVWKDYEAVYSLEPRWLRVLDRDGVDEVLVKKDRPLETALSARPDWRLAYKDQTFRLFVRRRFEVRAAAQRNARASAPASPPAPKAARGAPLPGARAAT